MRDTRLRELTPFSPIRTMSSSITRRKGESPIKGIKTRKTHNRSSVMIGCEFFVCILFSFSFCDLKDACAVMAVATLRIIHPPITADRMGTHYRRTFVCRYYPGVTLSANTVCIFLQKLGQDGSRRKAFYQKRADAVIVSFFLQGQEKRMPGSFCIVRL